MAGQINIGGKTIDSIYGDLTKAGISQAEASIYIGTWISEYYGKGRRTFEYRQSFDAAAAACTATFVRSFVHQDWFDGESVVQAGQGGAEDGFNLRFHRIETDLDALAADIRKAFQCLSEMRASLRTLLDEIKTEINRVNSDIYNCCHAPKSQAPLSMGAIVDDKPYFMGYAKYNNDQVTMWQTKAGTVMLPTTKTLINDPHEDPRVKRAADLARMLEEKNVIPRAFPNDVKVKDLVTQFGEEKDANGRPLKEMVNILPADASYPSLDAMLDDLVDREAAALRTSEGGRPAVADALGVVGPQDDVAAVPLARVSTLPPEASTALARAGTATIGDLAALDTREAARIIRDAGVTNVSAGDIAAWRTSARVLSRSR